MITISDHAEEVAYVPFVPFSGPSGGATMCEVLADQLETLGVHETHIEWFFEIDWSDDKEKENWMKTCIENPGPEA